MVSEIRDFRTAEIAIQASLTGHLVLSTLHTNDAPSAVTRLIDMGIEPFLIASSLTGVIAQRLVRVICPDCKESYKPSDVELSYFSGQPSAINLYRGRGCGKCSGKGYVGRTGIFELFIMTDEIRHMITEKTDSQSIKNLASSKGMRTLRADGIEKVLKGITTLEEVLRVTQSEIRGGEKTMPIFQYKGYKSDGTETTGSIEADGLKDAVSKVKDSGLFPKEVREYIHREKRLFLKRDDASLLPAITRQLSILLSSGVPLLEALKSLAEDNKGSWKGILIGIREGIAGGSSLSRTMSEHKDIFPEFYMNMIAAGETSGNLDSVLSSLADYLEKQDAIKQRVKTAMLYPVFMVCVGFIVLSFLFTLVIPKIVKIFEDTKSALPLITIILIKVSNIFRNYWWLIAGAITGV